MEMVDKSDQKMIPMKDRIEFLTKVYDRMAGLTANADTKAGIILAIHSFLGHLPYCPHADEYDVMMIKKDREKFNLSFLIIKF